MSILDDVHDDREWLEFFEYKQNSGHLGKSDAKALLKYIENKKYMEFDKTVEMAPPRKLLVNKSGSSKKRVVYSYSESDTYILKLISYLLYRYDEKLSPACYSFRRHSTAKKAISDVMKIEKLPEKYVLKVDIHNYFNSIPSHRLSEELEYFIDDTELLEYFRKLLNADIAYEGDDVTQVVHENRGAMAGVPISPFLANIYLKSLDDIFSEMGVPYFRYSDDILIIAETLGKAREYLDILEGHIREKGLELNPEKVVITEPGEKWDFLGFSYHDGVIDLSDMTRKKMKDKIKRKAKKVYKRRIKNNADFESCAVSMIKTFNKKYFDEKDEGNFTWSRWFFPVLTSAEGLKELDHYMLEYIRFLYSGRHYKGNYKVTYEKIRELGYRSLVHEYYLGRD